MLEEKQRLDKIIRTTKQNMEDAPEGTLRLGKSQGCTQYYHCKKDAPYNGVYIPKKEIALIKKLAQKSYDEKLLRYAEPIATQIGRLLKYYEDNKIECIYTSAHPERQKLITPVEPTYEQLLEEWISIPYQGKGFMEENPVILTNNGTRVRSKSEKILADYFESINLAYKYECPLLLKPYGTIYPDFTFLSRKTGREIYWEHEGMIDNSEYARVAVQKIELYEKNGIFPGENLILTFESSTSAINTELMKAIVQRYLQ